MFRNRTNIAFAIGIGAAVIGAMLIVLPQFMPGSDDNAGLATNLMGYGIFLACGGLLMIGMGLWRKYDYERSPLAHEVHPGTHPA